MKILFVAMSESVHTSRWIKQIKNQNWDIYLFPSYDNRGVYKDLNDIKICIPFYKFKQKIDKTGLSKYSNFIYTKITNWKINNSKDYYAKRLVKYINLIKPDIIHSLETQGGGYLVSKVKTEIFKSNNFPLWWHTNWGSDIYLFGKIESHQSLIKRVLENCDYYSCECYRDLELAKQFGFKGHILPVYPNTGGFNTNLINKIKAESNITSGRKFIMLKGYQGWAGRALYGISALQKCGELISSYTIIIYSNPTGEDIAIASALLSNKTGVKIIILPGNTSHDEILSYHSKSRISIGLSIGDAISTSLLEAMAMGSLPIQSCTACASEWFEDGVSGLIVNPEDPHDIERAIRKALTEDEFVNIAAEINYQTIINNADFEILKQKSINSYKKILNTKYV
jgi:glycosyltransferase involved in cell wall biosynthesis